MPTGNLFTSVFGRSPIGRIKMHMAKAHECATELIPFFEGVFANDWKKSEQSQLKIRDLEEKADEMKRNIRLSLPKSLFLPVPRGDLLRIVTAQDKIANCAKDIAGLVFGRKMQFPVEIREEFIAYVERSIDTSEQALKAINEMDSLAESGFKGPEADIVESMVNKLEDIESETDTLQVRVRKILFDLEKQLPPVDVMFLYKIIDRVGDLADRANNLGSRLELTLAS